MDNSILLEMPANGIEKENIPHAKYSSILDLEVVVPAAASCVWDTNSLHLVVSSLCAFCAFSNVPVSIVDKEMQRCRDIEI